MARTVQDAKLGKREQRSRLDARKRPYWLTINEGEHLGYYRGQRVGKWLARYRKPGVSGGYAETTLGQADDVSDADGAAILDFRQAQARARDWFGQLARNDGRRAGAYSVGDVLDDYLAGFQGKDLPNTKRRVEAIIRPDLGAREVAKLAAKDVGDWHSALAKAPARLRSKAGGKQNVRETADTEEARRGRRSSANRVLTILKAALNAAYRNGKVTSDDAWRRVKPFAKADAAKLRYLSDNEARRLTNACAAEFRPMVQGALLTGARYSELANLECRDFDRQAATVWLRETKGGEPRVVYLESEGVRLFDQATAGREAGALVFPRPDGAKWGASQQARRLEAACAAAKLEPTGFHDLRRTYGARLALAGVPLAVIAQALGHKDERITRKHYAHLCKSYVADTVRGAAAGLGIVSPGNVHRLATAAGG